MFIKGQSGNPGGRPAYLSWCREFIESEGKDKLIAWARSKNPKASLSALTLMLSYGFGKPRDISEEIIPVLQSVVNEQALMKMIYELTYPDRKRTSQSGSDQAVVESRSAPLQAGTGTTNGL